MDHPDKLNHVADDLVGAALTRSYTTLEAWDYGWCVPEYRRSSGAAITHDASKAVHLSPEGVAAFERAMEAFLRLPAIRDRYDLEELWGIVAAAVGTLPIQATADALREQLVEQLRQLTDARNSHVVVAIANVNPGALPLEVGPLLIGQLGDEWRERQQPNGWSGRRSLEEAMVDVFGGYFQ